MYLGFKRLKTTDKQDPRIILINGLLNSGITIDIGQQTIDIV